MKLKNLPRAPGVYIFKDKDTRPIYIGKSVSIRDRVQSYFSKAVRGKTVQMVAEAADLDYIETASEAEALLLEAKLVGEHMPKYNSQLRDDKSPLYIGITAEAYPRVITLRQTQIESYKLKRIFGPYVDTASVRRLLKYLRRAFPYSTHTPGRRACIHHEMGLCAPCPSIITTQQEARQYRSNIRRIVGVLSGNINTEKKRLRREMESLAKEEEFEKAGELKAQADMLEALTASYRSPDSYIKDPNLHSEIRFREVVELRALLGKHLTLPKELKRIEAYDVAHLAGTSPTASMITFADGEPDKRYYRHFRIRNEKINNDYDAMRSVLERRRKREDWGSADLVLVDGGKAQVKAALEGFGRGVAVAGMIKGRERLVVSTDSGYLEIPVPRGAAGNLVRRLRDEAHRFARRYHHKLVKKSLFG